MKPENNPHRTKSVQSTSNKIRAMILHFILLLHAACNACQCSWLCVTCVKEELKLKNENEKNACFGQVCHHDA